MHSCRPSRVHGTCFPSQLTYLQFPQSTAANVLPLGAQRPWMRRPLIPVLTCLVSRLQRCIAALPVAACLTHLPKLHCLIGQLQLPDVDLWPREFSTCSELCLLPGFAYVVQTDYRVTCSDYNSCTSVKTFWEQGRITHLIRDNAAHGNNTFISKFVMNYLDMYLR